MDLFKRLFAKSLTTSLFSVVFPQAPAGLKNPEFLKAYKGWVYACVRAIATDVGTIEFQLQKKSRDGWTEVKQHPALDVLATTNPFTTTDGLYKATSSFLDLTGNSFWYVAFNGRGQPSELWMLDPTKIDVIKSDSNYIQGYLYTNPKGVRIPLKAIEVIPFQEFNPEDPYKGKGPTEAAALAIDTNRYAGEWNRNFFFNSAMPALALTTEANLTQEQYDRLLEKWVSKFGGINNAHKPAILEGGLKIAPINPTAKEMDFNASMTALRDEILATFGVPKSVLGITEDVNRANAEASEYVFAKRVIQPRMRFIATVLSEFYLPLWGLTPAQYRIIAKDVVPQNIEADLKRKQTSLGGAAWKTINEVREEEGKDPVEGGDVLYIPGTLVTLEEASKPTPDPVAIDPTTGKPLPSDAKPLKPPSPKKAIVKSAADPITERVHFLAKTIAEGQTTVQGVYRDMASDLVALVTGLQNAKSLRRKDDDPNVTLIAEVELLKAALGDWAKWLPLITQAVDQIDRPTLQFGGTQTLERAGLDLTFNLANPRAEAWLKDRGLHAATQISDTVKEEIRARLVQGVKDGKGAKAIAEDISQFFDNESQWRALRVARTEVIEAYAQGSLEGARQAGLDEKRWLTAGDDRVEETCALNETVGWIPRESAFPSGDLAPAVHPNCRCDMEYRVAA